MGGHDGTGFVSPEKAEGIRGVDPAAGRIENGNKGQPVGPVFSIGLHQFVAGGKCQMYSPLAGSYIRADKEAPEQVDWAILDDNIREY
ncbi:MAG: hypothetical protein ACREC6_07620 [Hyphomicrobiaceae bacterium]